MERTREEPAYNYQRFTPEEYHFENFSGLAVGDKFRDAEVFTLQGQKVRLSDYLKEKPLVLETGSMTCPMYSQSVPPMKEIMLKHRQFDYLLLYVREAHPGERTPQHATQREKINAALKSSSVYGDHRETVVDSIDGEAHRLYGAMPNSIYVIDTDGCILFRSIWNNANDLDAVLSEMERSRKMIGREFKAVPPFSINSIRTLLLGGFVALWDFARGLPRLVRNHKAVGNM